MIADWQIRYTLNEDSLTIGGITLSSKIKVWATAKKNGDCRVVSSNLLFDHSVLQLCDLPNDAPSKPVAKFNGEVVASSGTILLSSGAPIEAEFVLSQSRKLLKILLKQPSVEIVDISVEKERWIALLQNKTQTFTDLGLFDYTFPYKERLFRASIDTEKDELVLKGFLGLRYVVLLESPDAQQRKFFSVRPRFKSKRDLITYSDKLKLKVYVPGENNRFKTETWEIQGLEKNKWTEVVRDYQNSKVSFHALRMPSYEASMRLSVVRPGSGNVLLPDGEIAILGFHENLFSDEFDNFFTHRIGWRVRTFNAIGNVDPIYNLRLTQGEVRFLLNQSVWNIDETFGLLGAAYQFNYANNSVTAPGVGFFWGRPMPNVFDRLLRWVPWFKYPKFTDLDFTYIPPHHPRANANLVLNFHGKMFFPNNFFFEGGLSFYQFSTFRESIRRTTTLQAFVGTVGLGYMF